MKVPSVCVSLFEYSDMCVCEGERNERGKF